MHIQGFHHFRDHILNFILTYSSPRSSLYEETHAVKSTLTDLVSINSTRCVQKQDVHTTLLPLIELVGIPLGIHCDRAPELIAGRFGKLLQKYRIRRTTTESHSPWQNRAKGEGIKPIKNIGRWLLQRYNAPLRLWDYAYELAAQILSLTCTPHVVFGEQTGFQVLTQRKPDISEYASFHFYSWIWHWDAANGTKQIGKWLGVAEGVGPVMTFWVLPITCTPTPRSSVVSVQPHELDLPEVKQLMLDYTTSIKSKCDTTKFLVNPNVPINKHDQYIDAFRSLGEFNATPKLWDGDHRYLPYEPTNEESAMEKMDEYIGSQIRLNTTKGPALVKIVSRQRDPSGTLIGTKNDIPQLDSRIYNVQFEDGHYEQYATNILAEALAAEYDKDGFDTGFISEISGYRKHSTSIPRSQGHFLSKNGNRSPIITTKGWDLKVTWKDGTSTWVPLSILKNSKPLLVARYAKTGGI